MKAKRLIEILEEIGVDRDVFVGDAFEQYGTSFHLDEESILVTSEGIKIGDDGNGGLRFCDIPKKKIAAKKKRPAKRANLNLSSHRTKAKR